MNNPVARIIDVNLNRAGEALRTLEEYARFIQESPALAARCKALRHHLAGVAKAWTAALPADESPIAHRDIAGDVGAGIKTDAENSRPNALSVAAAASRRAAEALRTLSEYAKIVNPLLAGEFEKIRYGLYAVEPILLAEGTLRRRLAGAMLYVKVGADPSAGATLDIVREAIIGGTDMIQLRDKEMGDGRYHRLAGEILELCRAKQVLLITQGRPHIAGLLDADGVHREPEDLPVNLTRRLIGPDKIIGFSGKGQAGAEKAVAAGADYMENGPVFSTDEMRIRAAGGLESVTEISRCDNPPCFASGGVNRDNLEQVLAAGARAVAVGAAITSARDIAGAAAFFKERIKQYRGITTPAVEGE